MKRMSRQHQKVRIVARNCQFCNTDTEPHYRDTVTLEKFLSERGKVLSQGKTGICSYHQRRITRAIKQARHVALVPFVVRA